MMFKPFGHLTNRFQFHSDSEVGLGPLVAGLSLGSPALMHFRLRAKPDANKDCKSVAITFVLRHVSHSDLSPNTAAKSS